MTKKNIALFADDMRYMKAFADYCIRYHSDNISLDIMTSEREVRACIRDGSVDVLVTDSAWVAEELCSCGIVTILLSDEKYVNEEVGRCIYRFQRMDDIMRQIYGFLAGEDEDACGVIKCTALRRTDIIGIFSPCFDAEREQFSRMLAKSYSGRYKVLHVNLSIFSECDDGTEGGISELMYYINGDGDSASLRILNFIRDFDGYHVISGVKHYRDLYDMSSDDVEALFACIRSLDNYERIIVDIGFLSDSVYTALKSCRRIYMPVLDAKSARLSHMWRDFDTEGHDELKRDVRVIELPDWWNSCADTRCKWVDNESFAD